jgi:hypothetical protein
MKRKTYNKIFNISKYSAYLPWIYLFIFIFIPCITNTLPKLSIFIFILFGFFLSFVPYFIHTQYVRGSLIKKIKD